MVNGHVSNREAVALYTDYRKTVPLYACVDKQQILCFTSYHKLLFKEFTQMHNTHSYI